MTVMDQHPNASPAYAHALGSPGLPPVRRRLARPQRRDTARRCRVRSGGGGQAAGATAAGLIALLVSSAPGEALKSCQRSWLRIEPKTIREGLCVALLLVHSLRL
jgi:hypothetical protein